MNKVKEFQVETIVDTLCSNMLSDKEQLRDISSIGELKPWFSCFDRCVNECLRPMCITVVTVTFGGDGTHLM